MSRYVAAVGTIFGLALYSVARTTTDPDMADRLFLAATLTFVAVAALVALS